MREHFDSDELLAQFGHDHFQTPGKWCNNGFYCMSCQFLWTCEPRNRNDTKDDTEKEPCGSDYILRNLHHGWSLKQYEFHLEVAKSFHTSLSEKSTGTEK